MTTALDVARDPADVNAILTAHVDGVRQLLKRAASGATQRELETEVAALAHSFGRLLLNGCMWVYAGVVQARYGGGPRGAGPRAP